MCNARSRGIPAFCPEDLQTGSGVLYRQRHPRAALAGLFYMYKIIYMNNMDGRRPAGFPKLLRLHYICVTMTNKKTYCTPACEVIPLTEKKLIIQPHRYGGETSVISVRLPKDMLAAIDRVAAETGRTRNEIVVMSMEFALENLEIKEK